MAGEPGARDVAPPADSSPAREQGDVQDRSSYVFANAWPRARRRLRLLEQAYDESTVRRLTSLRVGAGWSCLEVGAGAGSIARWPCSRVAGTGRVVAVDLDTRFLDEVEAGNLDVRRLDVATAELPPDEFDLVHARAVLMFLPGRDDILRRLVGCLRPGGWLLVEEADDYPVATSSTESFSLAWHAVFDGLGATGAGPVLDWARHLPVLLDDLGLVDVDAEVEVRMFRGGAPLAELMRLNFLQVLETVSLPEPRRVRVVPAMGDLGKRRCWFTMPALVAAWGRRGGEAHG